MPDLQLNEKILNLLRSSQAYISGEEISRKVGISRAGIWKHIHQLREQGYEIVAVPHLGYQLVSTPDLLLPNEISQGLNTKIIAREIYHYDTVGSTMDIALDLAMKGAREGVVILAESQLKGRGRLGRAWASAKHKGIYFSLILRPKISPLESPKLTLLAAVSVCQAIREMTKLDCLIKWPNDLIIDNKKAGGILTEMNAEMDLVKFVIIGVGINVNTPGPLLPDKATSLKEQLGKRIPRVELLRVILKNIENDYVLFQKEGFSPILEKWKRFSITLGSRIKVMFQNEYIEGEALDIENDGGLLVRKDSGFVEKIMAGDVVKVR